MTDIYAIAGSGMQAQTIRLNTIASNLANADTVSGSAKQAYKPLKPIFESVSGSNTQQGLAEVKVLDVVASDTPAVQRYDPTNPLANKKGYVFYPDIDVVSEMADMMSATRSFETNVEVLSSAKSMQQSLLRLGN